MPAPFTALHANVTVPFALTFDYRCPYARIAHDHVIEGLRAGAGWEVTFLPFSLGQAHVEEGQPSVWEHPERDTGLLALQLSIAIRDGQPEHFVESHAALFEHRHGTAGSLTNRDALATALDSVGVDLDAAWAEVATGRPLATIEKEHTAFAESHAVWGVPTFVVGDAAVFVRLLDPARGDGELAISTVERIVDQINWPLLNEFKHTSIPR
jgi:hypothetical protein